MDLLRRYLQAVGTYLPKSQQDDILKELGENLRAQMEDKQAELGRPLNEDEAAAILKSTVIRCSWPPITGKRATSSVRRSFLSIGL
jgi:hypothetical protein